ncbi:MAG: hypothetical protein RLQ12_01165 [Cyclobacteriaceae bacterium]
MKYLSIVLMISLLSSFGYAKDEPQDNFRIVLTHLLGKRLDTNANFYFGEQKVWRIDFNNGEEIKYTIISFDDINNPMCGINARDNFGDTCEICITVNSSSNIEVVINYSGKRFTYKGYSG